MKLRPKISVFFFTIFFLVRLQRAELPAATQRIERRHVGVRPTREVRENLAALSERRTRHQAYVIQVLFPCKGACLAEERSFAAKGELQGRRRGIIGLVLRVIWEARKIYGKVGVICT